MIEDQRNLQRKTGTNLEKQLPRILTVTWSILKTISSVIKSELPANLNIGRMYLNDCDVFDASRGHMFVIFCRPIAQNKI